MKKIKYIKFKNYFPKSLILKELSKIQDCDHCLYTILLDWVLQSDYKEKRSREFFDTELINFVSEKTLDLGLYPHTNTNNSVH